MWHLWEECSLGSRGLSERVRRAAATYQNLKVTVGAKTGLEVTLNAGGTVNVVDVNSDGQGLESTRTSISSTVGENRISNLPVNGRNFLEFATLTPGIVRIRVTV